MADIKWIKIATEVFDNRKIKQIECMPDGDTIIVIWFKLLCLAGTVNDNGLVYLTMEVPYTEQMLAAQFGRPLSTVQMALKTFEAFGMIKIIDNIMCISNWAKYQEVDKMNEIREYNRLAQQRRRQRLREALPEHVNDNVNDKSMTGQPIEPDIDTKTDIDIDTERETKTESEETGTTSLSAPQASRAECPFTRIRNLYHEICISFPRIVSIEGNRRKAVAARWRAKPDLETFRTLFTLAEQSSFLKGRNDRNWSADFDWMMKPTYFDKILEHRYDDRPGKQAGVFGTLAQMYEEAGNDEAGNG